MSEAYGTNPGNPSKARLVGGIGLHLEPDEVTAFVRAAARIGGSGRQAGVSGRRRPHPDLSVAAHHPARSGKR